LAREQKEGAGRVRRSIGGSDLVDFDPFILFDDFKVQAPAVLPDHPQRGYETVTYMLEGTLFHEDSAGNSGYLPAGNVQIMTSGKGIIYNEKPFGPEMTRSLQLWVSLKSTEKFVEPGYQELKDEDVPQAQGTGVQVKVIAGESMGIKSSFNTRTPILYLDFKLDPNTVFIQPTPGEYNCFIYVLEGKVSVGGGENEKKEKEVKQYFTGVLSKGKNVRLSTKDEGARLVLIGGLPTNEWIVKHGRLVMNDKKGIAQAMQDFGLAMNGFENGIQWLNARKAKDEL